MKLSILNAIGTTIYVLILFLGSQVMGGLNTGDSPLVIWLDGKGKKPYAPDVAYNASATFQSTVLSHLIYTDLSFDLKPGLIRSWIYDFKNKYYTLELAPNLKFHNGRAVTAKDLEFSLLRGFFSKRESFFPTILSNIDGVESIRPGQFKSGKVPGVKIIGKLRVRIKLKYPNPSFLHNLSYSYFSLVPIEALEKDYFTWKNLPIGAGPYKVFSSDLNSSNVSLTLVDDTNQLAPKNIIFTTEPDFSKADIYLWSNQGGDTKFERARTPISNSVTTIIFNYSNVLGQNADFRQMISFAIERAKIAEGDDLATATVDLLPRHFWGRFGASEEYDLSRAKQILVKLGSIHPDLLSKEIEVPVRTSELRDQSVQELKKQLNQLGLKVRLTPSKKKFWEKDDTSTIFSIISFTMPDVDPLLEFSIFRSKSPFQPFVPKYDEQFEKLFIEAAKSESFDLRVGTVKALSKYFFDNKIAIPLVERKSSIRYDSKKIGSLGKQDGRLSFYVERVQMREIK